MSRSRSVSRLKRGAIVAALCLAASIQCPVAMAGDGEAETAAAAYDLPFLLDTVPGRALTDQSGRQRVAADFADDLVVVGLVATRCPSLCAMRALDLPAVAKDLPEDVRARLRFVAISVDPADRPADLASFADGLHLDPARWTLLATDAGQAEKIRDAIGRHVSRPGDDPAEPGTNLFLFDRRGRLMQSFSGRALDRARVARDLVDLARFDAATMAAPQSTRP